MKRPYRESLSAAAAKACIVGLRRLLPSVTQGDRSWMARQAMQERFAPETVALAGLFSEAIASWKNQQYDVHRNGEAALLTRLKPITPRVLLDVGANTGEWTLHCHKCFPQAEVHAFEIDPVTAETLRNRLPPRPQGAGVIVNAVGLADRAGEVTVFVQPGVNTATTMLKTALGSPSEQPSDLVAKQVTVTTGDAYIAARGITMIDMLKLDVEGAEPQVLDGFSGCFQRDMITMVQFEYGIANLRIRYFLEDFYRFFQERGFAVGKIYPEGVAFKPYQVADEDFRGPNFLAVKRDRLDIIEALRCAPLPAK